MIENDPSAKMQVRSMGQLQAPASCYSCGNGTCEEGYIDLGCFIEYVGTLYLCMPCALQVATTVGCATPEQIVLIEKQATKNEEELELLRKELDDARQHIGSVNSILGSKFLDVHKPDSVPINLVRKGSKRITKDSQATPL